VAVALGAYGPDLMVKNAVSKRMKCLQKALPDALDLLVICAEAGLSLEAALTRVAGEMEHASPEMGDELGLTAVELGFLPDRRKALDNLINRCPLSSIRGVVSTLLQTEKYGTPLSSSLRVLSSEFRNERMLRAEAKAARLPAVLTVPMMIFILPTLFIVLIGPAILQSIDALKNVNF
jgi:tight adherence protein C